MSVSVWVSIVELGDCMFAVEKQCVDTIFDYAQIKRQENKDKTLHT